MILGTKVATHEKAAGRAVIFSLARALAQVAPLQDRWCEIGVLIDSRRSSYFSYNDFFFLIFSFFFFFFFFFLKLIILNS
jgi:hypothetical protein